jgi:aspartate/methionine/tyrosine aminotransferase
VVAAARRLSVHTVFNVPVASQVVAGAALADTAWVDEARAEYVAARDLAASALVSAGVRFHLAEGGVYFFCDFSDRVGEGSLSPLLERTVEHGVLLAPGVAFGEAYARWARLCFTAVPRSELHPGLEALIRALR